MRPTAILLVCAALACGRERVFSETAPDSGAGAPDADAGPPPDGGPADAGAADAGDAGAVDLASLQGLWDVDGSDPRGAYAGLIEITDANYLREVAWKTAT